MEQIFEHSLRAQVSMKNCRVSLHKNIIFRQVRIDDLSLGAKTVHHTSLLKDSRYQPYCFTSTSIMLVRVRSLASSFTYRNNFSHRDHSLLQHIHTLSLPYYSYIIYIFVPPSFTNIISLRIYYSYKTITDPMQNSLQSDNTSYLFFLLFLRAITMEKCYLYKKRILITVIIIVMRLSAKNLVSFFYYINSAIVDAKINQDSLSYFTLGFY